MGSCIVARAPDGSEVLSETSSRNVLHQLQSYFPSEIPPPPTEDPVKHPTTAKRRTGEAWPRLVQQRHEADVDVAGRSWAPSMKEYEAVAVY